MEQVDKICATVGLDQFESCKALQNVAGKVHLKVSHLLLGCAIVLLLLIVVDVGSSFLSNLVGFVYPSYMSFKALQTSYGEDDRHWLTYWTVYSFVTLFDPFLEILLSFIPMYHLFKVTSYIQVVLLRLALQPQDPGCRAHLPEGRQAPPQPVPGPNRPQNRQLRK